MALYVIVNLMVLIFLSLVFTSPSILIVGTLGMILVCYLIYKTKLKFKWVLSIIFIIAIMVMLIAYWGYIHQYGMPYYSGGSDDLDFEIYSQYIIEKGYLLPNQYAKDPLLRFHNSKGFLWVISSIMRLVEPFGGYHTIAFRVLNVNLLIGLGILTTSYFKQNYNFSNQKNAIILVASTLFPNALYISVHVFRDTLIIFLLFAVFYMWSEFVKREKYTFISPFKIIIITLIISYISYWIRNQSLIFIVAIILINIILNKRTLNLKNFGFFVLLLVIFIIVAAKFGVLEMIVAINERYTVHKLEAGDGLSNVIFKIPLFPFGVFIRFMYGLIFPIPIPILNIKMFFDVTVSYGTIIQIFLLPYLFKNFKKIDNVFIVFIVFMLGVVITTFTFRHFIMLYPIMIILIFRQFFITGKKDRIMLFIIMSSFIVLLASIYLIIK